MDREYKLKCAKSELWNYVHTVASHLPEKLNESQQEKAESLFKGLFYFGTKEDEEFNTIINNYIERNKLSIKSREDAMLYMCHLHNEINKKEGKELFLCTKENLFKRWGGDNNGPKL